MFPAFLLVVSALVWWSTGRLQPAAGIAVAAVVVSAAGLLSQKLARVLYVVWIYAVFPFSMAQAADPEDRDRGEREEKKWWLAPILAMLLLVGGLVIVGGSAIGPFLYALF